MVNFEIGKLFHVAKSVSPFGFIFQQDIELIMPLQFPFTTVNMAKVVK